LVDNMVVPDFIIKGTGVHGADLSSDVKIWGRGDGGCAIKVAQTQTGFGRKTAKASARDHPCRKSVSWGL